MVSSASSPKRATVLRWLVLPALYAGGATISAWMMAQSVAGDGLITCGLGSCSTVTSSSFGEVGGVPLTFVGAAHFVTMLGLSCVKNRPGLVRLRRALAVLSLVAVVGLVYIEFMVVGALCLWCTAVHLLVICQVAAEGLVWATGATPSAPHTSGADDRAWANERALATVEPS